jgi:anti-sigma factor RsiW
MSHERARGLILAGHGEPLEAADALLLREHLEHCPACSQYEDEIERGLAAFRSEVHAADAGLARRTRALLRARVTSLGSRRVRPWVPIAASVVGCAALWQWLLLARDLVVWCHRLGMSMTVAVALVGFVWLLWSALGAVATVLSYERRPDTGLGWPPSESALGPEGGL